MAATTVFPNGRVCMGSQWVVRYAPDDAAAISACPAKYKAATASSTPRTKLPPEVGCHTLRDRAQCCMAVDGEWSGEWSGSRPDPRARALLPLCSLPHLCCLLLTAPQTQS